MSRRRGVKPVDPRIVLRAFDATAEPAGAKDVTPHTLRHSAATAILDDGIRPQAVSELLGHAGTPVTAQVYAHLTTGQCAAQWTGSA